MFITTSNPETDLALIRQHQAELREAAAADRIARSLRATRRSRPRRRWHWTRRTDPARSAPAPFRSATGPPTTLEA